MLRLEALVVRAGQFELRADFCVEDGQLVAVIGPSGAGKSTLLAAIAGFLDPRSGRVSWRGEELGPLSPGRRPVSMLFQDGNLFAHLSVERNVALGIRPDLKLSAAQWAAVRAALGRVGLGGLGGRRPGQISGGQQSRAALARVLVQDRPLLLLDEPFSALGPALKAEMLDLVAGLTRESGATLLMVSHDPADARRIAEQVILVEGGRAHPPQETATLLDNPPAALRDYLG